MARAERQRRWIHGRAAILALLCGLLIAPAARAAPGDLSFRDCVTSNATTTGCTDVSATTSSLGGLNEAVEFGAGGTDVYGIAESGDSVVHLRRSADTGSLTFKDCVTGSSTPATGCTDVSATTTALDGVNSLVVTGDGRDAYAAGLVALVHFSRDSTTGTLTFADCIASVAVLGCTTVGGSTGALQNLESLGVGVGGTSVYAGSGTGPSMVHLSRDGAGKLTFQDCLSGSTVSGCTNISATTQALASPPQGRFAVSLDGKNIYAANDAYTIVKFDLAGSGAVSVGGCLTSSTTTGCTAVGPTGAFGSEAVALSEDGRHLYSTGSASVSRFTRDTTTGALTFIDCLTAGSSGTPGCTSIDAVNDEFSGPQQLAVSPDGLGVYLVGAQQLVDLRRNPETGQLSFARCFSGGATPVMGCTDITPMTNALQDLQVVAVSPSGTKVYVASGNQAAMVAFERQQPPSCDNEAATVIAPDSVTIPLTCSDPNGDALTRSVVTQPAHGTLGPLTAAGVVYHPDPGFNGFDSFTFQATAAGDTSNVGTETIAVARDSIAPRLTNLSVTPNTFRAARVTLHPKGTTFRFRLSEFSAVTLSIQRPAAGRRVGKACQPPTKANRRKPHCKRWLTVGNLSQLGGSGINTRPFNGRLAHKKLKPGTYRLRAVARDAAGNASGAKTARFHIVSR
jgi:Bacterial Ig domain